MTLMTVLTGICCFFIGCIAVQQFGLFIALLHFDKHQADNIIYLTTRNLCSFTLACITLAIIINFTPY